MQDFISGKLRFVEVYLEYILMHPVSNVPWTSKHGFGHSAMSEEVKDPFYYWQSNINTLLPESWSGLWWVLYTPVVNKGVLHTIAFCLSLYGGEDWLGCGGRVRRPMSCMLVLDAVQTFLYLQLLRRQIRASRWSESGCKNKKKFRSPTCIQ